MEEIQQCHQLLHALNHFRSTDKKVCDHEHLTDEYRGPAHKACNLNYHTNVFLFNIKNYSHKLRNIQRCKVLLNIDLPRVNNGMEAVIQVACVES